MARIRSIKPEFWTHPIMARMDPYVRLLALAILNHSDDHGYFMASPPIVQASCSPFTEDSVRVHGWLTELSRVGWIEIKNHPTHGPIGRVVNFSKHQKVNRPSDSKVKAYWFTEGSVSPHGALTEPSLLEQGAGSREQGAGSRGAPPSDDITSTDGNPEATPQDRFPYERREAWARPLIAAGCKIGANNWPAWKSLAAKYGPEVLAAAAAKLPATDRWSDQVEMEAESNAAAQRPKIITPDRLPPLVDLEALKKGIMRPAARPS